MEMTSRLHRVAVAQAAPAYMDLEAGISKCESLIAQAAKDGASLLALPENFLPGYPWYIWLGTPAWGMQFMAEYHRQSLVIGSSQYRRLEQAAAEHHIHVCFGFSERSEGSLYMGQALIDDQGHTVWTRRKLKPTHAERLVFGEGDGSDLVVGETTLGRIGGLCCSENTQPLSKFALITQHEQIHIAAWPSFSMYADIAPMMSGPVNNAVTRAYAVEAQSFVLAPCQVTTQDTVDRFCQTDETRELFKAGGGYARVYGPDGSEIAEPLPEDQEGLLYADIDMTAITLAKVGVDSAGHYARSDVTRLQIDRTRRRPVIDMNPEYVTKDTTDSQSESDL